MKITVTNTLIDMVFVLEVSEDLDFLNFKAFCELETGIPVKEMLLTHNGNPLLNDATTLKGYGFKDGDMVLMNRASSGNSLANLDFSAIQIPSTSSAKTAADPLQNIQEFAASLEHLYNTKPSELALLKQNNPSLADALFSGNREELLKVLKLQLQEKERRKEIRNRILQANPFDMETQRMIAEEIKRENIEANMEVAMEHNPEIFGSVIMLYVNCKVNGHPIKAFIDSGAQVTIMSSACAERCDLMHLVDTRFRGIAKGVGTQVIIGRIHAVEIAIANDFLTTSFSVLEGHSLDMLIGLDMLKRHQCSIDLYKNVLRVGTTGTETPFLPECEIPERNTNLTEEERKLLHRGTSRENLVEAGASSDVVSFDENVIKELVALGFSREIVIDELKRSNGDKMKATAALLAKSLKF